MKETVTEIADRQKNARTVSKDQDRQDKVDVYNGKWIEATYIKDKKWKTIRFCYDELDFRKDVDNEKASKIVRRTMYVGMGNFQNIYTISQDGGITRTIYAYPPGCKVKEG